MRTVYVCCFEKAAVQIGMTSLFWFIPSIQNTWIHSTSSKLKIATRSNGYSELLHLYLLQSTAPLMCQLVLSTLH